MKMQMLETTHPELSIRQQAVILAINRSRFYYKPLLSEESLIANLIKEVFLGSDCRYGYRKVISFLVTVIWSICTLSPSVIAL